MLGAGQPSRGTSVFPRGGERPGGAEQVAVAQHQHIVTYTNVPLDAVDHRAEHVTFPVGAGLQVDTTEGVSVRQQGKARFGEGEAAGARMPLRELLTCDEYLPVGRTADHLGVSQPFLSQIRAGKRPMPEALRTKVEAVGAYHLLITDKRNEADSVTSQAGFEPATRCLEGISVNAN